MSGMALNCSQSPPAQNAFRLKTRIKFRLFGVIPLFAVPLPFQRINLKTNTLPGTTGTIGSKSEFDPGGNYVLTDVVGKFDAVDAVLPAMWTVKADPNQIIRFPCQYAPTQTFQAVAGKTYKYKCNLDVINHLVAVPGFLQTDQYGNPPFPSPGNGSWATTTKGMHGESLFANVTNLEARYYRLTGIDSDGDEEYELETTKTPVVTPDGLAATFAGPSWVRTGYLVNGTTKEYRIVIFEGNAYLGHVPFHVYLPEHPCGPRTRVC